MPSNAPRVKRAAIEGYLARNRAGGAVVDCGPTLDDREAAAARIEAEGLTAIHPSDHPHIIAGQGTCRGSSWSSSRTWTRSFAPSAAAG